ncbi:sulfur carrier protein ThiS [Erwinia sp. S38]|uniref:sulfur carrier protein ThiS n=1 Tax=Erwinia sp. S38 TaxID=2769338 RepID=UPI00190CC49E|nr:sulfur carrier protein ThiS [Erwinia sp. S38]MBK0001002.1 sulfur carrier protein ThiS [Erwinia sp. S38]
MHIFLNGQATETQAATLTALLNEQQIDRSCVACALNGDFVPRGLYDATPINEGSKIEVLSPMQGG